MAAGTQNPRGLPEFREGGSCSLQPPRDTEGSDRRGDRRRVPRGRAGARTGLPVARGGRHPGGADGTPGGETWRDPRRGRHPEAPGAHWNQERPGARHGGKDSEGPRGPQAGSGGRPVSRRAFQRKGEGISAPEDRRGGARNKTLAERRFPLRGIGGGKNPGSSETALRRRPADDDEGHEGLCSRPVQGHRFDGSGSDRRIRGRPQGRTGDLRRHPVFKRGPEPHRSLHDAERHDQGLRVKRSFHQAGTDQEGRRSGRGPHGLGDRPQRHPVRPSGGHEGCERRGPRARRELDPGHPEGRGGQGADGGGQDERDPREDHEVNGLRRLRRRGPRHRGGLRGHGDQAAGDPGHRKGAARPRDLRLQHVLSGHQRALQGLPETGALHRSPLLLSREPHAASGDHPGAENVGADRGDGRRFFPRHKEAPHRCERLLGLLHDPLGLRVPRRGPALPERRRRSPGDRRGPDGIRNARRPHHPSGRSGSRCGGPCPYDHADGLPLSFQR